ncbi:MAG: hypothetical protein KJ623_04280 [Nanoarchaeota archaeon]|nr:hypothetical protein [Nanoarchaeota archaeon]MBU0962481.1 hypothetical protein [Nanoarchaeota archaeon]
MKILIGCPTSVHKKYCLKEYVKAIKSLTYKNFDILLVDNSEGEEYYNEIKKELSCVKDEYFENARERIVHSRNLLRKKVLEEDYDYLLSLEQDVIPPKDIIENLLKWDKKIISALYFKTDPNGTLTPLLWIKDEIGIRKAYLDEVEQNKLVKAAAVGIGCILIHKDVLKNIKFRYEKEKEGFDDVFFCDDAINNGFEVYCDTSIKCKHLIKGMDWENIKK